MTLKKIALFPILFIAIAVNADNSLTQTIIVEDSRLRPGAFGVVSDSLFLKDTAALLKRVPGANINRNGPLTGVASYRGQFGSRINAVVDGMSWKEVGPNSMDPPLSHIPAALTGNLTLYRGIAPVSSGIETIGGSMFAESRKGEFSSSSEFEHHGRASLGFSDVDAGISAGLLSTYSNDKHRFHASFSHEEGDDYELAGNQSIDPSQYDRDAYIVGYGMRLGAHELDFNYSNNDTGHTGSASLPMDIMSVKGGVFSAKHRVQLGQGRALESSYYYQDMRHVMNNFTLRPNGSMMGMLRQAHTSVDGGGLSVAFTQPAAGGRLKTGLDLDNSNHDAVITDPSAVAFFVDNFNAVKRDRYSIFSEWKGLVSEGLELEAGVRYSRIEMDSAAVNSSMAMMSAVATLRDSFNNSDLSQTDHNWDFDVILRQAISDQLSAEIGFARKTRSASYQERYLWIPLESTGGLADGRVYIGDVNLDPEVAYQFELGLEYSAAGLYLAPRAFYHRVNDFIQGEAITGTTANMVRNMMSGSSAVLQFTNVDAEFYGADLEWGYELSADWRLDGTASYVRGRRLDSADNLYRIAPFNTRAQLTYAQSRWSVATEIEAYSAQNDVAAFNGEQKSAGYGLLHLRAELQPAIGLSIGFGVENLLDKKYADHTGAINRVMAADIAVGDKVIGRGRNVYLTASYAW